MAYVSRAERLKTLFPNEPAFRSKQAEEALFAARTRGWEDVRALPKAVRERLAREVPWTSLREVAVVESAHKDTFKALVEAEDGARVETVLMRNARGGWTVCLSSQVGCAMRCAFCATGRLGLARSLSADEMVDQVRFWQAFLLSSSHPGRISNLVFMGMGEPLANYENVKSALNTIVAHTDIGPTHITVSTVGILPRLEQLLVDKDWPSVRLAISLHSANPKTRKDIVPTSYGDFLPKLLDWTRKYLVALGNRRHHLTFEYVLLCGVNDTDEQADALATFANAAGHARVNVVPYNATDGAFARPADAGVRGFVARLEGRGVTVTVRRAMGDDIAAACGQLAASHPTDR